MTHFEKIRDAHRPSMVNVLVATGDNQSTKPFVRLRVTVTQKQMIKDDGRLQMQNGIRRHSLTHSLVLPPNQVITHAKGSGQSKSSLFPKRQACAHVTVPLFLAREARAGKRGPGHNMDAGRPGDVLFYHARMARRAQYLRCSLCEGSEQADNKLENVLLSLHILPTRT